MTQARPKAETDRTPARTQHRAIARMCAAGARAGLEVFAYASATVIGLGLIPALITLADRATFLRLSNDLLDLLHG